MFLKLLYLLSLVFCSNPNTDEIERQMAIYEQFIDSLKQDGLYEKFMDVSKKIFDRPIEEKEEHPKNLYEKLGEIEKEEHPKNLYEKLGEIEKEEHSKKLNEELVEKENEEKKMENRNY